MTHTKGIAIIAMVASLILVTGTAAAQTTGPETAGASVDSSSAEGPVSETAAGSVNTDPGNIYSANISSTRSTNNWAGLYGNATGTLELGTDSNTLYQWDARAEYVYATTASAPDFTTLSSATADDVQTAFSFSDGSDNATETLSDGSFTVSPAATGDVTTTGVQSFDQADNPTWTTAVLNGSANNLIFTGVVEEGGTAYNGVVADYQTMVPTADGTTSGSTQTYNLYLELQ